LTSKKRKKAPTQAFIVTTGGMLLLAGVVLYNGGISRSQDPACCPCPAAAGIADGTLARATAQPKRYNMLVLVIDAVRQKDLGCYGATGGITPNIDHFATRSVQFQRAYAHAPWTKPSVASLFTGAYPRRHRLWEERGRFAILSKKANTMAEIFSHHGYTTVGLSANPNVARHVGLAQGFDRFPHLMGYDKGTTPRLTEAAIAELGRLAAANNPFFLYVHYLDPHDPYDPVVRTEYCQRRLAGRIITNPHVRAGKAHILSGEEALGKALRGGRIPTPLAMTEEEQDYLKGLYDCEISLVDMAVGRVLEKLRKSGLEDDTIVLLTADHGEEFMDHGLLRHGYQVYEEMVKVPLMVRMPGGLDRARKETRVVQQVDILPSLLALNRLPPQTGGLDGGLLPLGGLRPAGEQGVAMGSTRFRRRDLTYLIKGKHKLLLDRKTGEMQLFDLEADPNEVAPDTSASPLRDALAAELARRASAAEKRALPPGKRRPRRKQDPKPEVIRKQLESLGYIQ